MLTRNIMDNNTPYYKNVISTIKYKRERLLDGKLNCIPFELEGFEEELPGIEQAQYVIITANQKVGKTKLTDFLYLYKPFLKILNSIYRKPPCFMWCFTG